MTRTPQTARGRRILLALHLIALAACGWVMHEIATDLEPRPVPAPPQEPEPRIVLGPGEWVFAGAGPLAASALPERYEPLVPMPAAVARVAVRINANRVGGELYGPVEESAAVEEWRRTGWSVTPSPDTGRPRYVLRRADRVVVAWSLRPSTGGAGHLLVVPVSAEHANS
jgi:hypothetical protein